MDSESTSGGVKLKTVYSGKNCYPISIVQFSEVSEIFWRSKSGFNMITSSVVFLSGGHSVSDCIILMDDEVPMDTYS